MQTLILSCNTGAGLSLIHISHEQIDEGGFASPGGAHDGHFLTGLHRDVHIMHQLVLRGVTEGHMAKFHRARADLRHCLLYTSRCV